MSLWRIAFWVKRQHYSAEWIHFLAIAILHSGECKLVILQNSVAILQNSIFSNKATLFCRMTTLFNYFHLAFWRILIRYWILQNSVSSVQNSILGKKVTYSIEWKHFLTIAILCKKATLLCGMTTLLIYFHSAFCNTVSPFCRIVFWVKRQHYSAEWQHLFTIAFLNSAESIIAL